MATAVGAGLASEPKASGTSLHAVGNRDAEQAQTGQQHPQG